MSAEAIRRLEHDTLEEERVAPAHVLVFEPTEKELRLKEARRAVALGDNEQWLSPDNPAIWNEI